MACRREGISPCVFAQPGRPARSGSVTLHIHGFGCCSPSAKSRTRPMMSPLEEGDAIGARGTLRGGAPPDDARFHCRTLGGRRSQVFVIPEQDRAFLRAGASAQGFGRPSARRSGDGRNLSARPLRVCRNGAESRGGVVSRSGLRLAIPRFTRPKLADETEHGGVVPTSRGGGRGLVDESPSGAPARGPGDRNEFSESLYQGTPVGLSGLILGR
jgi:hypothetical protein